MTLSELLIIVFFGVIFLTPEQISSLTKFVIKLLRSYNQIKHEIYQDISLSQITAEVNDRYQPELNFTEQPELFD